MAKILFVCGDMGGTTMLIPVIKSLKTSGHDVSIITSPEGMASKVCEQSGMVTTKTIAEPDADFLANFDAICINTCASGVSEQNKVYTSYKKSGLNNKLVFTSDGFFNHGLPNWRNKTPDYWFVINSGHKASLVSARPDLDPKRIIIVGNPAFDPLKEIAENKHLVREKVRKDLEAEDANIFLWWSTGMTEIFMKDVYMVLLSLEQISKLGGRKIFIPRFHPKLDKLHPGLISMMSKIIFEKCQGSGIEYMSKDGVLGIELCLASDIILSVTCTEDIKNVMIGGPPVVHFQGPIIRNWFERDLNLKESPYLPDIIDGQAYLCERPEDFNFIPVDLKNGLGNEANSENDFNATERLTQAITDLI